MSSRTEKELAKKQEKERRLGRFWTYINVTLIVIIIFICAYYYLVDNKGEEVPSETEQMSAVHGGRGLLIDYSSTYQVPEESNTGSDTSSMELTTDRAVNISNITKKVSEDYRSDLVQEEPHDEDLLIHFAGDTMFAGKVEDRLTQQGYDFPYQYVSEMFQNDDLTIVNLETPITERGEQAENKSYTFKSSPKALPYLFNAGIDAVNLANNHTLDQGVGGLLDTMDHLSANGIKYVGAGKDQQEAYAPMYVERKGKKVALLGYSRVLPHANWAAGNGKPGLASIYDPTAAIEATRRAREEADLVIVVVHWGQERVSTADDTQTTLARALVDAGADLVIGGHPHVMQGIEHYNGKWIAYSTGNFIFTKSLVAKTWETAVFEARCKPKGECSLKLIPYWTEVGQPVPMNEEDGYTMLKEVEGLSQDIRINRKGEVKPSSH